MVRNVELVQLLANESDKGSLIAIEGSDTIPFDIARVYYIYGVGAGDRRGFHSHKDLEQVLICVNGSVKILVEDGFTRDVIELNSPDQGLYVGPMVWREMFDFSEGAVLMVLASRKYMPSDYEKDHERFLSSARECFEARKDAN